MPSSARTCASFGLQTMREMRQTRQTCEGGRLGGIIGVVRGLIVALGLGLE